MLAANFFRTFLQQYVAYRRVDPSLLTTALTAEDVAEAALPTDYEAITSLLESFAREKTSADELTFLRFCLQAPQKLAAATRRPLLPLIDCLPLADESDARSFGEGINAGVPATYSFCGDGGTAAANAERDSRRRR